MTSANHDEQAPLALILERLNQLETRLTEGGGSDGSVLSRIEDRLSALEKPPVAAGKPLERDVVEESFRLNDYGVQLYYDRRWEQAVRMFEDASRVNPKSVEIWSNLGAALTALGMTERAVSAFRQAAALDAEALELRNNRAVLALLQTKPEKALEILEKAAVDFQQEVTVLLNLAQAWLALDRHDKAVETWKTILAIDPAQEEAQQHLRQYYQHD